MTNNFYQLMNQKVAFLDANEEEADQLVEIIDDNVLVDFDFDPRTENNFDVFITIRHFWNDWNPIYTEIF